MIPCVVIVGEAGSGKDTLAAALVDRHGGVALGFADPLKQMAGELFGFTADQLYGPSASRNAVDTRFAYAGSVPSSTMAVANDRAKGAVGRQWCARLLPGRNDAVTALHLWMDEVCGHAWKNDGLSARYVLQTLGTEWGRALQADLWIEVAYRNAKKLLCGGHTYSRQGGLVKVEGAPSAPLVLVTDGRFPNEAIEMKARGCGAIEVLRPSKENTVSTGVAGHASEALMKTTPKHFYDRVLVNDGDLASFLKLGLLTIKALIPFHHTSLKASEIAA